MNTYLVIGFAIIGVCVIAGVVLLVKTKRG